LNVAKESAYCNRPLDLISEMKIKSRKWWVLFSYAAALVGGLVWRFVPSYVTSPRETRERVLLQDLFTMRAIISQYTLDKQKRLHSLDDLVAAGYLKEVPVDPLTGRKDTWVVKCSGNGSEAGFVDIDSGYGKTNNEGTRAEPCP
jgi:general secretion pathway protein G